jgi:tRNA threonylcarbamoyl adenosine modification protein (Sua5/YciO/YrdC/YwlC family)
MHIHPENPQPRLINQVADTLRKSGVIIYPTDTIYGMGCDIHQPRAIERICRIKQVDPLKATFSFIFRDLSHISDYTKSIDNSTFRLLKQYLPGPFTFILNAGKAVPKLLHNKRSTIGIRIPDNRICLYLTETLGNPLITTTLPGDMVEEYTDPEIIHEKFGSLVDIVIDGGPGGIIPSTVIDCTGDEPAVTREGLGDFN